MEMNWLYGVERITWYLNLAATIALIFSLRWNGLYRVYRCLFAYLIADAAQTLIGLAVQSHVVLYGWTYVGGQLVKIVLAVFVVLELYRLALAAHPALARFGRRTVSYALAAAAAVAACGLLLGRSVAPDSKSKFLYVMYSFERTMDTAMLVFLVIVIVYMTWFPVRLKRNAALYIGSFLIYFLSRSAGLLLLNSAPQLRRAMGIAMLGVGAVCLLAWLIALQQEGEETTTVIGHRWDPAAADRLTGQLEAINTRLLRLFRGSSEDFT
jgi:hypothetical protein